ncbi:MAG: hypothetical protein AB7J28_16150 [Hyphomonadaceae bacterium]
MRMILMAAALALAACGQASAPATQTAEAQTPAPAAAEARVMDDAIRVTCNAYYQVDCGDVACRLSGEEAAPSIPVAVTYDGDTGGGELCMATSCEAVYFAPLPGGPQAPSQAMSAAVMTAQTPQTTAMRPGPYYNGTVVIARDASTFQFIQYGQSTTQVWGGACEMTPEEGME